VYGVGGFLLAASEIDALAPHAPPMPLHGAIALAHDLKENCRQDVRSAFVKSNEHQHVELFNAAPAPPSNMSHD
jgi:hypothetical protein